MDFLRPGTADTLAERYGDSIVAVVKRAADYMSHAPVVLSTPAVIQRPDRPGELISQAYRSDGNWVWTDSAAIAVREGRVVIPVDFAETVMAADGPPRSLPPEKMEEALTAIQNLGSD